MEKFQIDLTEVANMLDPNRIPVRGNEHRLIRVAFDLFRVDGDESDDLWQIQADDDGNEFLVRTYNLEDEEDKISEASDWSVLADKKYANLTVLFQGVPLIRLASKDYGAEDECDGKSLQGIVFRKLATDGEFVLKLLNTLPQEKLAALKQAGLLKKITDWLQSKDITDPIVAEIKALVEESEPGYYELWKETGEREEKEPEQAADEGFTGEEVRAILEQTGATVKFEPTMHDFMFKAKFPNGYTLSVMAESRTGYNFTVRQEPRADVEHNDVSCLIQNEAGRPVDARSVEPRAAPDGEFYVSISDLPDVARKLAAVKPETLKETGVWPSEEQLKGESEEPESQEVKDPQPERSVPFGDLEANDEWSLAFLDLHLTKTAHCGVCDQDGDDKEQVIQEAYHMIEHDLEPGSVEAADLSTLVWEVETGEKGLEDLQAMMKKLSTEQEAATPSYRQMFDSLLESFLAKYNVKSLDELPDEAKQKLFEEADSRWTAENEADTRLASLGIPRVAEIQANPDFYTPGSTSSGVDIVNMSDDVEQNADVIIPGEPPSTGPAHGKFDVTDVESGQGEWAPEEIELTEEDIEEIPAERFVNPEEVKKILEEIKSLAPSDKEALETFLKS